MKTLGLRSRIRSNSGVQQRSKTEAVHIGTWNKTVKNNIPYVTSESQDQPAEVLEVMDIFLEDVKKVLLIVEGYLTKTDPEYVRRQKLYVAHTFILWFAN